MQTVPVFAYLLPILILFGFGPVAALIATVIYAMPPMVRVTLLALRGVAPEIVEFGRMAGSTPRQLIWKVMLPAARAPLMVGVNQVIMLSLNMVIIASMIGAGGLGYDVLAALRRLDIGAGIEAGLAIVRARHRARPPQPGLSPPAPRRRRRGLLARRGRLPPLGLWALALAVPGLAHYPERLEVSTSAFWAGADRVAERQLLRHPRGDQDLGARQPAGAGPPRRSPRSPGGGARSSSPLAMAAHRRPAPRRRSPAASPSSSPSPATGSRRWSRSTSSASRS